MKRLIAALLLLPSIAFAQSAGDTRTNSVTNAPQIYNGTRWITDWDSLGGGGISWALSEQAPTTEKFIGIVSTGNWHNYTTTFTPDADGVYALRYKGDAVTNTAWVRVGTSAGAFDVLDAPPAAERLTPTLTDKTFYIEVVAGTEYFVTAGAGGGGAITNPAFEIRSAGHRSTLIEPTSDIYQQFKAWNLRGSGGVGSVAKLSAGTDENGPFVVLSGDNTDFAYAESVNDLPLTKPRYVEIIWDIDTAATQTAALRLSGPSWDIVFEIAQGIARTVDAGNAEVISNVANENVVRTVVKYNSIASADSWRIFPDYGLPNANGASGGVTGSFKIRSLNLNYSPKPDYLTYINDRAEVDVAPAWDNSGTPVVLTTPYQYVNTGVDLTKVDSLVIHYHVENAAGPRWSSHGKVFLDQVITDADHGYMLDWFNQGYVGVRINSTDLSSGIIGLRENAVGFIVTKIEFKAKAQAVPKLLGAMMHMKSARFASDIDARAQGFLALKPGTITNGAVDYPMWSAMYTEYIAGNDIVFPADIVDIVLRNVGGNAANEGDYQAHAQARDPNNPVSTAVNNGGGSTVRGVNTSAGETRMNNRAYQLYTIIDTY